MKSKYLIIFLILKACTPSDLEPEEELLPPEAVNLIFPEDDTECNTGVDAGDTQSTVTFRWESSENTNSYEVFVTESETNTTIQIGSNDTNTDITINKASVYEWYVVSKSESTDEIATSEVWRFYNAGDPVVNHAPFSADVLSPTLGSKIPNPGSVLLEWEGSDIDDDIVSYEVYFGTENPPNTLSATVTNSNHTVDIVSGTYYWQIGTIDSAENSSLSDVFWFNVD